MLILLYGKVPLLGSRPLIFDATVHSNVTSSSDGIKLEDGLETRVGSLERFATQRALLYVDLA